MPEIKLLSNPIVQIAITLGIAVLVSPLLLRIDFSKVTGLYVYVVQSGSMEPSIMTGDLLLTRLQSNYSKNDVITFTDSSTRIVTHRIESVESETDVTNYNTKGDANPSIDQEIVTQSNVVGKVVLVIPKAGFLVSWGQSWQGIIVLIIIPATALITYEILRRHKK